MFLIDRVDDNVPRLLVNLERVGEMDEYDGHAGGMFGSYREEGFDFSGATRGGKQNARDVAWIGEADKGVRELAEALGWEKELDELYDRSRAELEEQDLSILDTSETASPKASTSKKSTSPITNAATNKSKAIAGEIAGTFQQDETDESKADVAANESDGIDQLVADIRSMGVSEATEVSDKGTDIATLPNAKDESTAASDEATPGETPQPSPPTRSSPVDQIKQKLTHKF
ncbi:Sir2 histone deacetylase Hst2 [Cystobasidiomycetes sp. EMM_F5]